VLYFSNYAGKWLGNRQIRCNWATKGAGSEDKQSSDAKSVVDMATGSGGGSHFIGDLIITT